MGLGLDQVETFGVSFFGDRIESLVGFGEIILARPGRRLLQRVRQPVRLSVRLLDCLVVFGARLRPGCPSAHRCRPSRSWE